MFVDLNPDPDKIIYSHFTCATGKILQCSKHLQEISLFLDLKMQGLVYLSFSNEGLNIFCVYVFFVYMLREILLYFMGLLVRILCYL